MKYTGWFVRVGAAFSILLLAGCGILSGASSLENSSWTLIDLAGTPPIEGTSVTVEFADGNIGGSTGCNSYGGAFELNGESVAFEELVSTLMACLEPEGVMDQEQRFLELMNAAESIQVSGDRLQIITTGGDVLEFEQTAP
jgi:heat shock protein HslJ